MATDPRLQQSVEDINKSLFGRPVIGVKGPIAPWYGAFKPPSLEDAGFIPNEEWDYRVANRTHGLGMEGQQLPERAKGWDKYGRPYYGEGITGWANKNASNFEADWEEALSRESQFRQFTGGVWAILKNTGMATVLDPLMGIAKGIERGIGISAGLPDIAEESPLPKQKTLPDEPVPEMTEEGTPLVPKMAGSELAARIVMSAPFGIGEYFENIRNQPPPESLTQSAQSFLNRLAPQAANTINTLYDALNPLNVAYNTARVVADKDNYESNIDELEASYHASSILYTTALDPAVREEFVRRANAGEDPGLLAIELENPAAEFAGQMIFDPLNLWVGPGKVAADAAYLKNARTVFVASDEVADAIKTFRLHDEAEAIASLTRLSEASAATAARTIGNRADDLGVLALTANGKRAALVDTAGQVMQSIMYNVDNPDDMLELTQAIARRSSGSADEVAEATAKIMAIAKRANMSPSVLFSPASFDLGYVLREVMKSDPQKFLDETLELINAGDKAAVAENAYRLFDDAAEKIYPSVAKRLADGEDIGFVAEALHKMDKGIFGKTLKAANNVFAHIYMGMSPGYAARNAIMDNFLINLDLGPSNPFSASRWHEAGIKWQGGAITRAAERGISSPVSAAGVTAAEGAGKWTSWGLKMGEAVERNSARLVVGKTIDRTMRQLLGRGLPTLEPILRAGGLSDDIGRFLINTTINNFGDTSIAVNALRSKNVDVWRHISQWLDDDTIKALDGMGLLPSILDSLAMSGNIDDALRNAAAVFDEVDAIANSALDEMPTISRSNPALPDAIALTESGAGDATKLQFGAVIESNNNSMVASLDSMNGVRTKANNMVHSYPQSQHQEISDILGRYTVDEGAWGSLNDFATKNSDVFQSNIKRVRRSRKPLDLIEEWDNLGLNALRGEASAVIADTTIPYNQRKAMFMKEAQDAFVDMKYQFWEAVREELFGQANGLYSEMSQYTMATMGTPLNDSQLQLAAHYYEQAAAYARAFPFEDGLHYFRPPTPRFAVGGAGGETVFAALDDGIKTPEHLLNAINAKDEAGEFLYRSEGMSKKIYKDLTEVNSDMAYDVLYNRRYGKTQERIAGEVAEGGLVREATEEFVKLPPPPTLDGTPSLARALYEQQEAVTGLRKTVLDNLGASRGEILELAHTDEAEDALKLWQESADAQIKESRILSQDVATQTRDFILHDYRSKRNIDTLAGYVYPYQFWYTQTYTKMMKRMARNPAIASNYLRYKDALGKIHAGAPDWWKYTINSNELLGLDMENPLYFNLEASLNPLNGLTGVDFDDPYKRTNWFTGLLMDLGKHGPSTHTLYSLAVAVGLYAQGEEDAANRWAGRIIPQTRTIKAVTALAFDKPVELDPWVALMADGLDPYERNRVGRALGAMANEEKYTEAELFDAANKQSGPLWDEAVLRATKERAPGQISSFFLGVGFKGRTNSDIQIDKFYGDWHRLWELEPNYSPQEMQRAMSDMRKAYPFMDTLMLSKKGGLDRDRAYAYNVLSRIPPSMSDDVAKAAGLNPELLSRFYDAKGHMETWPEQDQDRFMAGMVDIAAVLDMPDNATRDAWINAKDAYKSMLSLGEDNFGSDIWALQDTYYALMGDDPDDRQQAYDFLDANPRLQRAMEWKDQVIMFSPTLSAYYTSLDKIQAYYTGEMYKAIEEELGTDIWDQWDEYNAIPEEERRSYWRSHPDLGRYMDIKEDWQDLIAVNTINVGNMIKPGPGPSVRAIMGEMGIGSAGVREFAEQYPTVIDIPDELLLQALGPELYRLYQDDEPLPPAAKEAIEALGLNVEE
jgi:hypothetical protein